MQNRDIQEWRNSLLERECLIEITDLQGNEERRSERELKKCRIYSLALTRKEIFQEQLSAISEGVRSVVNGSVRFLMNPFRKRHFQFKSIKKFFMLSQDEIEGKSTVFRYQSVALNANQMRNGLSRKEFNRALGEDQLIPIHDMPEGDHGCTVCGRDFRDEDRLRILKSCSHSFHVACIDRVLREESRDCPTCKIPVLAFEDEI